MKHKHILITFCLFMVGSANSSFAAYTLTNGNFAGNATTGWTTTGTVSAASGAAVISAGGILRQDFSNGVTGTAENYDFQLDFSFSVSAFNANDRIRLRDNNYSGDIITLRLNSAGTGIESFNVGTNTWFTALSGLSMSANTNYWMRVIGTDLDVAGRSYTVGFSTNGSTYTTSSAITAFHGQFTVPTDFESIGFESGTGKTMTVDNITVVPEPSAALLGGLGVLCLLRRRR
jgi:hypothetical protein